MFAMRATTKFDQGKVKRSQHQASIKSLGHAAALVRITARRMVRRSKRPSQPGQPPHTQTGALRNAIIFDVAPANDMALIGPAYNMIADAGAAHEQGGFYRGRLYPKRAFMGPALAKISPRLPEKWAGRLV